MKIILTKHSKQRRKHYKITEDKEILPWIEYFSDFFNLKDRKDGKYKISYKNKAIVIKKQRYKLIVITFRGFKDFSTMNKRNEYTICNVDINNIVYRRDYNNKLVSCGKINEDNFTLQRSLYKKYKINLEKNSDLIPLYKKDNFIHYEESIGKWVLNDFERRESKLLYMNEGNKLIRCGKVVEGVLLPHHQLWRKKGFKEDFLEKRFNELVVFDKKNDIYIVK